MQRGQKKKQLKHRRGADPVYAVEDAATGLYLNLDGERASLAKFAHSTRVPATDEGRLELAARLNATAPQGAYDVVRVDA